MMMVIYGFLCIAAILIIVMVLRMVYAAGVRDGQRRVQEHNNDLKFMNKSLLDDLYTLSRVARIYLDDPADIHKQQRLHDEALSAQCVYVVLDAQTRGS